MMASCRNDVIDLILPSARLVFLLPLFARCPRCRYIQGTSRWEKDLAASFSVVLPMASVVAEKGAAGMRNSAALDLD